jgi:hypothetical protein
MRPAAKVNKIVTALGVCAVLLFPAVASAAVQITEVMYDAPGSDSGHEWMEISTDSSIDLHGFKLNEGGSNHALAATQGTSSLAAGDVAIISNNPQTFLADFPNYTGTIFKSSFSLSNTGETILLKDAKLSDIATLTYNSSEGGAGDGNSLHLNGQSWTPGAPNPGSLAATKAIVKPAAPVAIKAAPVKKTSSVKSTSKSAVSFNDSGATQSAAVANASAPSAPLPQNNLIWTALGLIALIIVGVGGAIYARNAASSLQTANEALTADEFEIVG